MNKNQKIALIETNLKLKDLAVLLDRHPGHLSAVFSGKYRAPETRKRIAQALGTSEAFLWPSDEIEESNG